MPKPETSFHTPPLLPLLQGWGLFIKISFLPIAFANLRFCADKQQNFIVLLKMDEMKWFANGYRSGGLSGMNKSIFIVLILGVLLFACSDLGIKNYDQVFKEKGHPPIILGYYAPEAIRPGATWNIYLRAEDQDGDIAYIATMLYEAGFGYYSTDYTRLEGKDRKQFFGYISLRTPPDINLTFDKFTMEIVLRDSQNNQSEIVKLPLTFAYHAQPEIPPEWQAAANHRLGRLVTRIQSMASMKQGSGF
jgi:hypothetical protein